MGKSWDRDNRQEDSRFRLLHHILFRLLSRHRYPLVHIHMAPRTIALPLPIPHRARPSLRPLILLRLPALPPALHPPTPATTTPNVQVRYPSHHPSFHLKQLLTSPYCPHICIHRLGCQFQFRYLLWSNTLVHLGCMDNTNSSNLDSI